VSSLYNSQQQQIGNEELPRKIMKNNNLLKEKREAEQK
jgi:hypothetical protein